MRGSDEQTGALFSCLSPDALVPRDHPLRGIRHLVNAALEKLSGEFRWFIGLSMDAPVWDVTVFTKNRQRPLEGDVAISFLWR